MHPVPYAWTYAMSFSCSQWQARRYSLPELPSASLCIHHQILDVLHLLCLVVQWDLIVLNYKHMSMAFLICLVHHVVSTVRSWTYFTCLVTLSAPVLKDKHTSDWPPWTAQCIMVYASLDLLNTDFISHGHPMQLGVGHCFLPASILLQQGCFGQWAVLLLLEWGAICVKLREIWTYNIHWHLNISHDIYLISIDIYIYQSIFVYIQCKL